MQQNTYTPRGRGRGGRGRGGRGGGGRGYQQQQTPNTGSSVMPPADLPLGPLDENRKFFLANIAYTMTAPEVKGWFSQFGVVNHVKIVYDKIGNSKGYGFMYMNDEAGAQAVESFANNTGNQITMMGRHNVHCARHDPNKVKPQQDGAQGGQPRNSFNAYKQGYKDQRGAPSMGYTASGPYTETAGNLYQQPMAQQGAVMPQQGAPQGSQQQHQYQQNSSQYGATTNPPHVVNNAGPGGASYTAPQGQQQPSQTPPQQYQQIQQPHQPPPQQQHQSTYNQQHVQQIVDAAVAATSQVGGGHSSGLNGTYDYNTRSASTAVTSTPVQPAAGQGGNLYGAPGAIDQNVASGFPPQQQQSFQQPQTVHQQQPLGGQQQSQQPYQQQQPGAGTGYEVNNNAYGGGIQQQQISQPGQPHAQPQQSQQQGHGGAGMYGSGGPGQGRTTTYGASGPVNANVVGDMPPLQQQPLQPQSNHGMPQHQQSQQQPPVQVQSITNQDPNLVQQQGNSRILLENIPPSTRTQELVDFFHGMAPPGTGSFGVKRITMEPAQDPNANWCFAHIDFNNVNDTNEVIRLASLGSLNFKGRNLIASLDQQVASLGGVQQVPIQQQVQPALVGQQPQNFNASSYGPASNQQLVQPNLNLGIAGVPNQLLPVGSPGQTVQYGNSGNYRGGYDGGRKGRGGRGRGGGRGRFSSPGRFRDNRRERPY